MPSKKTSKNQFNCDKVHGLSLLKSKLVDKYIHALLNQKLFKISKIADSDLLISASGQNSVSNQLNWFSFLEVTQLCALTNNSPEF